MSKRIGQILGWGVYNRGKHCVFGCGAVRLTHESIRDFVTLFAENKGVPIEHPTAIRNYNMIVDVIRRRGYNAKKLTMTELTNVFSSILTKKATSSKKITKKKATVKKGKVRRPRKVLA